MTEEIGLPPHLQDLPPTARLVWRMLDEVDREATVAELAVWCRTGRRTIRKALVDLDEEGLVEQTSDPTEPGKPRWRLSGPE